METTESRVKELEKLISEAQDHYHNGESTISDDEYDALVYELSQLDEKNPLLFKVGAEPVSEWKKVTHRIPLGSLDKVNYPDELSKWMTEKLLLRSVVVTEKLDGLSIALHYQNGKLVSSPLRGSGVAGEDIISNTLKMKGVVRSIPGFDGIIRGEIILTKSNLKAHFPDYANPRNACSGISRRFDGKGSEHLEVMCYQVMDGKEFDTEEEQLRWLEKQGFKTPAWKSCSTAQEVIDLWNKYHAGQRESLDYEIDGLVVACSEIEFSNSLGETNLKPKGKLAFKFAFQYLHSKVTKITWQTGASGRVTPICWFNPVNLLGTKVEKASVYNVSYVQEIKLDVGAEVLVCKANEIIPRVERVVRGTGSVAPIPENCPECHHPLKMEGEYLMCNNSSSCPAQVIGKIENWIGGLNVLEWGSTLLSRLVETKKVTQIPDLYKLKVEDLASIDRMGEKSAQKCYDLLWKSTELPLEVFLGSLSIPMVGTSIIKLVVAAGFDTLEKIQSLSVEQLEGINGLGPAKAKSLYQGLRDNKPLIQELLDLGLKIKEKTKGSLTGKSFAITGTLSIKRAEVEQMIIERGGTVKSSVTKGTDYLIISDTTSQSSKAVNARKLGTKLINEEDFLQLIH